MDTFGNNEKNKRISSENNSHNQENQDDFNELLNANRNLELEIRNTKLKNELDRLKSEKRKEDNHDIDYVQSKRNNFDDAKESLKRVGNININLMTQQNDFPILTGNEEKELRDAEDLSTPISYLLLLPSFFGIAGLHKFYMGKIGWGVLYILTWGFAGIGTLVDLFTIPKQIENIRNKARIKYLVSKKKFKGKVPESLEINNNSLESPSKNDLDKVLFKLAKDNEGVVTIALMTMYSNLNSVSAKEYLDNMEKQGFILSNVDKNGNIVYIVSEFLSEEKKKDLEF